MSEHSKLVAQLQRELSLEHDSRRKQQELNTKLQHEYDVLLKKLAEAELHIDKLRLGANVELNKWYVLRYSTEQNSTLRQRLEADFDPSNRVAGTAAVTGDQIPTTRGVAHKKQRNETETVVNLTNGGNSAANDNHTISDTSSLLVSNGSGESNVLVSPQPHGNGLNTINVLGGLLEQDNTGVEGSCSQLSLLHLSSHSSAAHLSSHTTDSDELCTSQMSSGTIATCGSAESMLLAHLLQLHSLQEQLSALKSKINEGATSPDEILSDLSHIQDGHRQLSADIETSNGHFDRLREKYNGQDFGHIARSREAVGKELANLSIQLQELGELIRTKTPELSGKSNVPPSSSATESVLLSHTGKQGVDSDSHMSTFFDSLNSPALPTKYLSQDTTTSQIPIQEEEEQSIVTESQSSSPRSVTGRQSSVKTEPSSSVSLDKFMNVKSRSTYSGTPLEELLDVGVAGCVLNVASSCDDTLSELSDILPSDAVQSSEVSHDEVLKEAKQNLERADRFRLERKRPTHSQLHPSQSSQPSQPSQSSQPSHITPAASPFTDVNDRHQSSLVVRHSTPRQSPIHKVPPNNHTPSSPDQIENPPTDPTNPLSPFTHRHTLPSPFPRPRTGTSDSGFAGSEFPSRAGKTNPLTTVDSPQTNDHDSIPYQQLVEDTSKEESGSISAGFEPKRREVPMNSSEEMLIEEDEDDDPPPQQQDEQEKRPSLTIAAIDSLRSELASLKEQIMQTVQQQKDYASLNLESHSRSPLIHSHSSPRSEQRRPSSSNATVTPLHGGYDTQLTVPQSISTPRSMSSATIEPSTNYGSPFSRVSFNPHSLSSLSQTDVYDDRHSLHFTPNRRHSSKPPSSLVSFTPSANHQNTRQNTPHYVPTPTRTVTPLTTPLCTPHQLGLNRDRDSRRLSNNSTSPVQERTIGSPDIVGSQPCPRCGESSVQVSSRDEVSEDGSKRHRYVTYVHNCHSSSVVGTPSRGSASGLRHRKARGTGNSSSESINTVVGESVMPGRELQYETHHSGVAIEDEGILPPSEPPPPSYRRSSTPAAYPPMTAATQSCSSHVHHSRAYHHHHIPTTSTAKQKVKVHNYSLTPNSNQYTPSERRVHHHHHHPPQVIHHTSSAHKPSTNTRSSSSEYSPEYHPHITSQFHTTGRRRSKSRRRVVRLVPRDEVYYSEPGVRERLVKRQRKRRHFEEEEEDIHGGGVRGGGVRGDGVRGVYDVKPRQMYVVEGEECSSSDNERDVEVDGLELEEIMELATELKRRSRRMQTSLHTALTNKHDVY